MQVSFFLFTKFATQREPFVNNKTLEDLFWNNIVQCGNLLIRSERFLFDFDNLLINMSLYLSIFCKDQLYTSSKISTKNESTEFDM